MPPSTSSLRSLLPRLFLMMMTSYRFFVFARGQEVVVPAEAEKEDGSASSSMLAFFQGHAYQFVPASRLDWFGANADAMNRTLPQCSKKKDVVVPGHLLSITSLAEHDFVVAFLMQRGVRDDLGIWIGLHDQKEEGRFEWTSGEPFVYSNWTASEPNDALEGGDDCVHLVIDSATTALSSWNDVGCDQRLPYVIEYDDDCEQDDIVVSMASDEDGHIYTIIGQPKDWYGANDDAISRTACDEVTGHLVTITSAVEQAFVKVLYQQANIHAAGAWIGLHDFAMEGTFQWVNGEPLNASSSFANWGVGQPDNHGPNGEDCVALVAASSDLEWNDAPCDPNVVLPYIIEFDCAGGVQNNSIPTNLPTMAPVVQPLAPSPSTSSPPTNGPTTSPTPPRSSSSSSSRRLSMAMLVGLLVGAVMILVIAVKVICLSKRANNEFLPHTESESNLSEYGSHQPSAGKGVVITGATGGATGGSSITNPYWDHDPPPLPASWDPTTTTAAATPSLFTSWNATTVSEAAAGVAYRPDPPASDRGLSSPAVQQPAEARRGRGGVAATTTAEPGSSDSTDQRTTHSGPPSTINVVDVVVYDDVNEYDAV